MADAVTWLQFYHRSFWELRAVALPLLGFFFCMIAVLTAVAGVTISFFSTSTSERVHHYPRPAVERNVTATSSKPRLFMVVPDTKDESPTKNTEANSAAVPAENAEVKKSKSRKPKVIAGLRNNYQRPGYYGNVQGYAEEYRNGPQRLLSNW